MQKKKKMLGAQMKTDSSAQASWIKDTGHKAPKGTYHYTGGQTREVAGRAAEKARYPKKTPTGAQAKYRASLAKKSQSNGNKTTPPSVSTAHKDYLRNERNIQNGVYSNGRSVRLSDKTKETRGWEQDANRMYSKNHKTLGAYTRRSASTDKAQFNWANGMSNQAKYGARNNNKDIQKKMFERQLKTGSYAKGKVTDRLEQGGLLAGDARYSSFYTSYTGEKYADRFKKRKKRK